MQVFQEQTYRITVRIPVQSLLVCLFVWLVLGIELLGQLKFNLYTQADGSLSS